MQHTVYPTRNRQFVRDVGLHEGEAGMIVEVFDIVTATRNEVVDRDNLVAAREQAFAQMRPNETGPAGNDDSRH
jgi:hypothetical protein